MLWQLMQYKMGQWFFVQSAGWTGMNSGDSRKQPQPDKKCSQARVLQHADAPPSMHVCILRKSMLRGMLRVLAALHVHLDIQGGRRTNGFYALIPLSFVPLCNHDLSMCGSML